MVIDRLEREREYGELRCEKPSFTFVATDFLSVAKETHRRCPTSSTGSVRRGACLRRTFRTKSRWKTHCMRSTQSSNGKSVRFFLLREDASGVIKKALSGAQLIPLPQRKT